MPASLNDLQVLIDFRDHDISSWTTGLSYGEVLKSARASVAPGRHIVTLREYLELWLVTVPREFNEACNQADYWMRQLPKIEPDTPLAFLRHPVQSTILVDTYLDEINLTRSGEFEATVLVGDEAKERVLLPPTGKIYEIGTYGTPTAVGGHKNDQSESFEHRWWAFSTEQVRERNSPMALFANGGAIGCFCELIKAHYYLTDRGGYYRVLTLPDQASATSPELTDG